MCSTRRLRFLDARIHTDKEVEERVCPSPFLIDLHRQAYLFGLNYVIILSCNFLTISTLSMLLILQVYVDPLSPEDMEFIGNTLFPAIDKSIIAKMVAFNNKVNTYFNFFCVEVGRTQ